MPDLIFPGGPGTPLWDAYHELLKRDRRYRVDVGPNEKQYPNGLLEHEKAGERGGPTSTKRERGPMGQVSGRKAENRRLRQEIGSQAGAAVAELHQMTARIQLQQKALATEQLQLVTKVDTAAAGRGADLRRLAAMEEKIEGFAEVLEGLQARLADVEMAMPDTITARLWGRHVELDNRLFEGAERFTQLGTIYERFRWLLLGILPAPRPGRLHVLAAGGAADGPVARVITRGPDGKLQKVS